MGLAMVEERFMLEQRGIVCTALALEWKDGWREGLGLGERACSRVETRISFAMIGMELVERKELFLIFERRERRRAVDVDGCPAKGSAERGRCAPFIWLSLSLHLSPAARSREGSRGTLCCIIRRAVPGAQRTALDDVVAASPTGLPISHELLH